jgi:predicted unusual protein kinase regulating ubiquinone biosynthesis (AarF/ABC1/UbiB family)
MTRTRSLPGAYRSRARRVRRFFLGALLHALWWDVVLNRPVLRHLRTDPMDRWRRIARDYRALAVELGGVMIKLGQFLSARLDVIPAEIAAELAELQDEVPPADFHAICGRITADLGRPIDQLFARVDPTPLGAASLAQVHRAEYDGREVVVKVLRPDIETIVETDLAAFADGTRWLKLWRTLRRRVDVDWIHREFAAVTRRELDLAAEGRSAERFARDVADDPSVLIPDVVWPRTGTGILTMTNVAGIRIADTDALDAAGVDRSEVAKRLYRIYMRQFFDTHFVHADPHPGNLFVHPLPPDPEAPDAPTDFRIAFVDFGMTTEIPVRLREALREFAIGLGTRDARRMVESYLEAGTLLPEADVDRMVMAHEALFDRFWGVPLAEMRDVALTEGQELAREFSDLIFDAPIQLQADMIFSLRAVGLLAGLCSRLDPAFDPWQETIPFAQRYARDADRGLLAGVGELVQGLVRLPGRLQRALDRAEHGKLTLRTTWSPASSRRVDLLIRVVRRLAWAVAGGGLLIAGTVLRAADRMDPLATPLLVAAAAAAVIALLRR